MYPIEEISLTEILIVILSISHHPLIVVYVLFHLISDIMFLREEVKI